MKIIDDYLKAARETYKINSALKNFLELFIKFSFPILLLTIIFFLIPLTLISLYQALQGALSNNILEVMVNLIFPAYFTISIISNLRFLKQKQINFSIEKQHRILLTFFINILISIGFLTFSMADNSSFLVNWITIFRDVSVAGIFNGLGLLVFLKSLNKKD